MLAFLFLVEYMCVFLILGVLDSDGKTASLAHCCTNETDCVSDVKVSNNVETVNNSTTLIRSAGGSPVDKNTMAVKHKLDDSKVVDSIVSTKMPKFDCENDVVKSMPSPLNM